MIHSEHAKINRIYIYQQRTKIIKSNTTNNDSEKKKLKIYSKIKADFKNDNMIMVNEQMHTFQQNRTESSKTDPHKYDQLITDKVQKQFNGWSFVKRC